jgi:hypothetical protein
MSLTEHYRANAKTIKLRTRGAVVTLECSNLFLMSPSERAFVLGLLEQPEAHEAGVLEAFPPVEGRAKAGEG